MCLASSRTEPSTLGHSPHWKLLVCGLVWGWAGAGADTAGREAFFSMVRTEESLERALGSSGLTSAELLAVAGSFFFSTLVAVLDANVVFRCDQHLYI